MNKYLKQIKDSPRRNRYEIWAEILDLCLMNEVSLSQILRELHLRTDICKEYLSFLIQKGLLRVKQEYGVIYKTTEKGEDTLKIFFKMFTQFFS